MQFWLHFKRSTSHCKSPSLSLSFRCTVVLYNPRKNRQSHITNSSRKTITCLGFSDDGRHLVTGECGHLPSVRVWDIHDRSCVAEFPGHKYGINCVAFAPNNKYIVSVSRSIIIIIIITKPLRSSPLLFLIVKMIFPGHWVF